MNGLINFEGYTSSVLAALKTIDIFKTVSMYGEMVEGYPTPAIFFDIERWEDTDANVGGNLSVKLTCNFYIVREFTAQQYNQKLRNAALAFTGWVHGRQFGPGTAPAFFVSAESGSMYKDGDSTASHHTWCVTIEQDIAVGIDPFDDSDAPPLKEFWLGGFPEVGEKNKDDYILLAESKPDGEGG